MGYLTNEGWGYFHEAHAQHDPIALLRLAGQQLVGVGYQLTGHGHGWITAARSARGYGISGLDAAHNVTILADGSRVRFDIRSMSVWKPHDVAAIDGAVGALLVSYDSMQVQQSLFGPPSSGAYAPAPHSQRGPTHVVERQVVVVRCKFCQAHTPLDAGTCQACGAAKFT